MINSIKSSVKSVETLLRDTLVDTSEQKDSKEKNLEYEKNKIMEFLTETKNECNSKFQIDVLLEKVNVDSNSFFSNLANPIIDELDKNLEKKLEYLMGVKIDSEQKDFIKDIINNNYIKYKNNYEEKREEWLNKISYDFIDVFTKKIEESDLSEETKKRITNINTPNVAEPNLKDTIDKEIMNVLDESFKSLKKLLDITSTISGKFSDLKDSKIIKSTEDKLKEGVNTIGKEWKESKTGKIVSSSIEKVKNTELGKKVGVFIKKAHSTGIDMGKKMRGTIEDFQNDKIATKKELIENIKDALYGKQEDITNNFKSDLTTAFNQLLTDLEKEFNDNISNYSTTIKALNEDIQPLIELSKQIEELNKKVESEHQNLIRVIGE